MQYRNVTFFKEKKSLILFVLSKKCVPLHPVLINNFV